MGMPKELQPPAVDRWLIRMASWLVPGKQRAAWRSGRERALEGWWILVERGEIPAGTRSEMTRESWRSFPEALYCRFERESIASLARTPISVVMVIAASLLVLALASRGFTATQDLFDAAGTVWAYSSLLPVNDAAQNRVVGHLIPLSFAAVLGLAILKLRA